MRTYRENLAHELWVIAHQEKAFAERQQRRRRQQRRAHLVPVLIALICLLLVVVALWGTTPLMP